MIDLSAVKVVVIYAVGFISGYIAHSFMDDGIEQVKEDSK